MVADEDERDRRALRPVPLDRDELTRHADHFDFGRGLTDRFGTGVGVRRGGDEGKKGCKCDEGELHGVLRERRNVTTLSI